MKIKIYTCNICKQEFSSTSNNVKYCKECRRIAKNNTNASRKKPPTSPMTKLEDLAKRADVAGMSYGQYVQMLND